MTAFFSYVTIILLSYNVVVAIVGGFLFKHYPVFKTTKGKRYFFILLFISCHSLYLLLEIYFFKDFEGVYTAPFSLLYGPVIYRSLEFENINHHRGIKKALHFFPFLLFFILILIFIGTERYFKYNQYVFRVLYYVATVVTLLYYGIKFLVFCLKKVLTRQLTSLKPYKLHFLTGTFLLISGIIHLGFLFYFDKKNIVHSSISLHLLMTIGLVVICIELFELQKKVVSGALPVTKIKIDPLLEGKYAKSRLDDGVLKEYQLLIEELNDDFFYQPDLKLEILEDKLKVKKYYLTQTFSIMMDTSFIKYTNKKRVEYARELLESEHEMSMTDIAFHVGFSSVPNFKRAFVLNYSKTPLQFRREFMEKMKNDFI